MNKDLSPSESGLGDVVTELRVLGVNVTHINEKISEFMTDTKEMRKIVYHLDKNAATRDEVAELGKNLGDRISSVEASQSENWRKIIIYVLLSGGAGGATSSLPELLKLLGAG